MTQACVEYGKCNGGKAHRAAVVTDLSLLGETENKKLANSLRVTCAKREIGATLDWIIRKASGRR